MKIGVVLVCWLKDSYRIWRTIYMVEKNVSGSMGKIFVVISWLPRTCIFPKENGPYGKILSDRLRVLRKCCLPVCMLSIGHENRWESQTKEAINMPVVKVIARVIRDFFQQSIHVWYEVMFFFVWNTHMLMKCSSQGSLFLREDGV